MSAVEFVPESPAAFGGIQGLLARILDLSLIVACARLAVRLHPPTQVSPEVVSAFVLFACAFAMAGFPVFGVYQSWRGRSAVRFLSHVTLAWGSVAALTLVMAFAAHITDLVSRLWFTSWVGSTAAAMLGARLIVRAALSRARNAGMNLRHVAIVGCGEHCQDIVETIRRAPATGFRASVAFDARPSDGVKISGVPAFRTIEPFVDFVRRNGIQEIWLALPLCEERTLLRFVNAFRDDLVNVRFIPDVRSLALFGSAMIDLVGMPAINLVASPFPAHAMVKKEVFDRVFASIALIALTPIFIVIAIAVKCSSPGPVFFTQKRMGADGRVFRIHKFRTMRVHAETAGQVRQATRGDPRITRVGAFLRRTSLDELPQFYNVLRGEMSVVGPRPHAIEHDELYRKIVSGYIHRYRIKPGITGWAQVNGFRGETDRVEKMVSRVEHDLYYLHHWSFALDMRIVAATVVKGLVNRNAY
ncbi:undecaprenyl-phosphate glucose phosphotransferase [Paraburkholderia dinghuensis]|uniref:Undecaprenyl-phosphate glucose phosphotransferase n=1 Tax=Paraburkholderia dinghuensis TaxID=2305225 RepID=A0A3N6PLB2_9BURK|nr:undecaprenyl-phosphate glucose phosphotransferase [Paraburkholderia dinghuensis]RQH02200.1 undecaprenyl-phosphate glucose phosphotransferase [Paraburkholderia dinghuensis]